jgi:HEAT repeat protein
MTAIDFRRRLFRPVVYLLTLPAFFAVTGVMQAADPTPVEHVSLRPARSGGGLGTKEYTPSERERPFFNKLDAKEKTTGNRSKNYNLDAKDRQFVGWFGIVREITEDAAHDRTLLTVEHKYFDGLTDAHIQAVSFNGAGDFRAVLRGVGHDIPRLSLVKVYGTLAAAKDTGMTCINAAFARDWHWGTFTFISAYGTQNGSIQWRKLNRVALDDVYDPYPNNSYYEQRIGKRAADDPLYRRLLKPAGRLPPDTKRVMIQLIESLDAEKLFPTLEMVAEIKKRHDERAAVEVLLAAMHEDEIAPWSVPVALGRLAGPDDLPRLLGLLSDTKPTVRQRATEILAEMGKGAAPAVSSLANALRDDTPSVRSGAARALSSMRGQAKSAIGPLMEHLTDRDADVRLAAAEALWWITFQADPSVRVLAAALKDGDADTRSAAATALEAIGPAAIAAGPALIAALKDREQFVRYTAAIALRSVRPAPKAAIPALVAALKDEYHYVRSQVAETLGRYGAEAKTAVPALVTALKDEDMDVRWQAAEALGEIGPAAVVAVAALIHVLRHDEDENVRWASASALGSIDTEGRAAIPALILALAERSAVVRRFAADGLGKIGAKAKAALPALSIATKDQDPAVRIAAAAALWKVARDRNPVMPVLIEALKNGQYPGMAAEAIRTIGPPARAAVSELINILRRENGYAQNYAAQALGSIGPSASAAVPALVDALRLRDGSSPCAVDAAEALWSITRHPRAIPVLIELLGTDDGAVPAAEALGRIGPAGRAAISALRTAANCPDPAVRAAANEALRNVSGDKSPVDTSHN